MPSNPDDVAHLLRRSGFVAPPARVAQLSALDWPAVVESVLDVSANPPIDLPLRLLVWNEADGWDQYVDFIHWWLDRCVSTPTPIVEKMTLFWQGHFTSSFSKVYNVPALFSQHQLYRSLATGNFETLAQKMAIEPAMLKYLDNADNLKDSPNQNFARELMELFLLGVGNYTEDDVISSARAWTGHLTVGETQLRYQFQADEHDDGNKTFFGTTKNWDGPDIITEILNNPAKRPIVARFMARKLWEFFAYQFPASGVIDTIAQAFAPNLDITAALRAIFNHPEFRSVQAKTGLVRSPIEFVVATLYHTAVKAADAHPEWYFENMGQEPFNPPNVSGWRPNAYWVNTSAFAGRAGFAMEMGWVLADRRWWANRDSLSVEALIDSGAATFVLILSSVTRTALINWLANQRTTQERWQEGVSLTRLLLLTPEMNLA